MQEKRFFNASISLRDSQGDEASIVGRAAKFNKLSENLGNFKEKIAPGAFRRSIQSDRDIRMFLGHDQNKILGRRKNKTLTLAEDDQGLNFRCLLPDTSDGRDVRELVRRGDLNECSFGFDCTDDDQSWDDGYDDDGNRCAIRTLKNLRLHEISLVSSPAYENSTSAEVAGNGKSTFAYSSHIPVTVRSYIELFPEGIPAEIRARVGDITALPERRRRLADRILSI